MRSHEIATEIAGELGRYVVGQRLLLGLKIANYDLAYQGNKYACFVSWLLKMLVKGAKIPASRREGDGDAGHSGKGKSLGA